MSAVKFELTSNNLGLVVSSVLLVFPCLSSLFGLYWLFFGGGFSYEGWYFIIFAVYISALFVPAGVYYYLWPKPVIDNRLRLICSCPFIVMMLFSFSLIWV